MPNTPARIGQGISVWTATAEVPDKQREQAKMLLQAFGQEIFVSDEDYLDMATALSGPRPAPGARCGACCPADAALHCLCTW